MTKRFSYIWDDMQVVPNFETFFGSRVLKNGTEGNDVKELQTKLIRLGYDLGRWGADGDFGDMTEMAVRKFQKDKKLKETGIVDEDFYEALEKAIVSFDTPVSNPRQTEIVGGNCYIRSAPNKTGKVLGVGHTGEKFEYQGQTTQDGWNLIIYKNQNGWVSGKYSRLVK